VSSYPIKLISLKVYDQIAGPVQVEGWLAAIWQIFGFHMQDD
jgi:hypothetical protein